eukprot:TRINITY_DN91104_c0_g1_i1.p1 TRINITY_DN91104_c0_g1~~TRINITY_DN91104_c0_g1_i1.p1  ORF type:complete len:251 (+),score=56.37 TRINITY_DN91104_c0_g1_i1:125-877(+)
MRLGSTALRHCLKNKSRKKLRPTTMGSQAGGERWGGKAPEPGRKFGNFGAPAAKRKAGLVMEEEQKAKTLTVRGVLDAEECQAVIAAAEKAGMELQTSRGPAFGEAVRHHSRVSFDDLDFADALWASGLDDLLANLRVGGHRPTCLNENIRIYKYEPGDVFGQHIDGSNVTSRGRTEYTLLVYLSGAAEGMQGGETAFYGAGGAELLRIAPVAGSALLHRHGRACLLHEALPVTAGVKYVLRSDVVFSEA